MTGTENQDSRKNNLGTKKWRILIPHFLPETCLSGFEETPDVHSLGGVCHDVDVVDLEACLCACQKDETCTAVDWKYVC